MDATMAVVVYGLSASRADSSTASFPGEAKKSRQRHGPLPERRRRRLAKGGQKKKETRRLHVGDDDFPSTSPGGGDYRGRERGDEGPSREW